MSKKDYEAAQAVAPASGEFTPALWSVISRAFRTRVRDTCTIGVDWTVSKKDYEAAQAAAPASGEFTPALWSVISRACRTRVRDTCTIGFHWAHITRYPHRHHTQHTSRLCPRACLCWVF